MGILDNLAKLLSGGDRQPLQAPLQAPGVQPTAEPPQNMSIIASLLNGQKPNMGRGIRAAMTGMGNIGNAGGDRYRAFAMGMGGAGKAFTDQEQYDQKMQMLGEDRSEDRRRWEEEMALKRSIAERKDEIRSKLGLNPQYGVDEKGNPVLIQVGDDGTAVRTAMPDGVTLSKEPIKLDAGTHFVLLDPITRAPVGRIEKDLAGAAQQKELGESEGKKIAAAPGDIQAADTALDLIDNIRNDPYKEFGTGLTSNANRIEGTGGYDFQNKVNQAKSGAFLTAIQQMRGMGALSNAEGGAATAAVTRMDTATSTKEFDAALNDYEKIIKQGKANAQAKLGISGADKGLSDDDDPMGIR